MSRSCKIKCCWERIDSFSPSHICVSSGFGSAIFTFGIQTCHLLYFSKKVEKLRAKRPKAWKHANSEVQKQRTLKHRVRNTKNRSKYTNHKSQTMTFWTCWSKLLFPKRSAKMIDGRTEPLDFDLHCRKTQNPKTFFTTQVVYYPKQL